MHTVVSKWSRRFFQLYIIYFLNTYFVWKRRVHVCACVCAWILVDTLLPNIGRSGTPPSTPIREKPHAHPPRGAAVVSWWSEGSNDINKSTCNEHRRHCHRHATTTFRIICVLKLVFWIAHLCFELHICVLNYTFVFWITHLCFWIAHLCFGNWMCVLNYTFVFWITHLCFELHICVLENECVFWITHLCFGN